MEEKNKRLKRSVLYMARGPYRFLVVLLLGAASIGGGILYDWKNFSHADIQTKIIGYGCLAFYLAASCIYGYLIYTNRWKTAVWDVIIKSVHARQHL